MHNRDELLEHVMSAHERLSKLLMSDPDMPA
jgi:hypothetical protein